MTKCPALASIPAPLPLPAPPPLLLLLVLLVLLVLLLLLLSSSDDDETIDQSIPPPPPLCGPDEANDKNDCEAGPLVAGNTAVGSIAVM